MNTYELYIQAVELGSFSAAAKALNRTPSAVSKQIALLEQRLGVQLFSRTTRALSITKAGRLYYEQCKEIVKKMEQADAELKNYASEPTGQLNITWPNVLSNSDVVRSLSDFCDKNSGIKLNVKITNEVLNLTNDGIDIAIRSSGISELKDSNLVAIKLSSMQPIFCATPSLLEKHGHPQSLNDVVKLPQIIPTYVPLIQALKKHLPDLDPLNEKEHHRVDEINGLRSLVSLGIGAGFIARHVVAEELSAGKLVDLTGNALPELPIYLVFEKTAYAPAINRCLVDYLKQRFLSGTLEHENVMTDEPNESIA